MQQFSRLKIHELERISGVAKSNVNRAVKHESVVRSGPIIVGIEPETVEGFMLKRKQEKLYRQGVYVLTSQVGGTAKTSATISLAMAYRRLAKLERPIVLMDTDPQGSLTLQLTGSVACDAPVLKDYFEGTTKIEDILTPLGEGVYLIKSSLDNLYLDRKLNEPKLIKAAGKKLIEDIFKALGTETKIFIDTPPQLSSLTQSIYVHLASLPDTIDKKVLIPVRCDSFSIQGARIAVTEARTALETFNLNKNGFDIHVFMTNYDQRVKVSIESMRTILEDELLKELLSPIYIRFSTEISKRAFANQHIFSAGSYKATPPSLDYTDFLLFILGFSGGSK